ncbi:MAG: ribosome maturation factor RimP [Candidatus Omnitrophica bacterium]|nr:ribosome maturation factor RimP [Candidatus Omnitrophota bacterium]MCM8790864.1 ribosome maturation factor RimP [Candidatus Omnitrophota bacterium]
MDIVEKVKELVSGYLSANEIELVDITYRREQPGMVLRLLVDTSSGIKLSECESLNNYLSELLDREDIIQEHYVLEVSSPGLDRPIKTDRDFERSIGKMLELTTYEAIDGRKTHEGLLIGMNRDEIVIEFGGISTLIPRAKIAMARLKIEF